MYYNFSETTFPSKDGVNTVYAEIYTPRFKEPKGIIQLAHGMIDYVARYRELADFLCENGYIFAGNHHLGHGKTAARREDFGYFADKNGIEIVLRDMHAMNKYLRVSYPDLPVYVMGHSMGSFLARLYAEKYPHSLRGLIIHGTGGPNRLAGVGCALTSLIAFFKGWRHRSKFISNMAFGVYNKKFPKSEGNNAWLTRDLSRVESRDSDEYTSFSFTLSGYRDLFNMVRASNSREWFREYSKELPTLIMSGSMDPVGAYGKGPSYVYKQLLICGCKDVEFKLYEGARHELFNEVCRREVYSDILLWLLRLE